ncbi:TMV resistance protein N [Morella rubra]|uniref:TMV resistance protein N n=1 Tax=Morella rubra TaxID=262757 RepID=A0A6A1UM42_9ROSI|nr:TMV resistance protein N [Morella rubra]
MAFVIPSLPLSLPLPPLCALDLADAYEHFSEGKLNITMRLKILFPFLDKALSDGVIGVVVFSPNYCKSYFCLHELALFTESKKKVIPIFCDIKPSQLRVPSKVVCEENEHQRFSWALEEAKHTVGLSFNSFKG